MKRNMLTIVILALSIVNLVLTALVVFSVVPNVKKTNNLIDQVAKIINLDLEAQNGNEKIMTPDDLDNYALEEEVIINLKKDADSSKERYAAVSKISLTLYNGVSDYDKVKKNIDESTESIYDIIRKSFKSYTIDEAKANEEVIKENIIKMLNDKYGHKVVQSIVFGSLIYQ